MRRTLKDLTPSAIRAPFGAYAHGVEIPAGWRIVMTSGQLGVGADDVVPEGVAAQAHLCFANLTAILAERGVHQFFIYSGGHERWYNHAGQFHPCPRQEGLEPVAGEKVGHRHCCSHGRSRSPAAPGGA